MRTAIAIPRALLNNIIAAKIIGIVMPAALQHHTSVASESRAVPVDEPEASALPTAVASNMRRVRYWVEENVK